jgi:hypothetical protein
LICDHRQRLQIEHRHGFIATVRRPVTGTSRCQRRAPACSDIAEALAGSAIDPICAWHATRTRRSPIDGDVVSTAVTFDVELRSRKRLRLRSCGPRDRASCAGQRHSVVFVSMKPR